MKLTLTGGFYAARSLIADSQRCVNLFPEKNQGDSKSPITTYPTPGLKNVGTSPNNLGETGRYVASNGNMYSVQGNTLYLIKPNLSFVELGNLGGDGSIASMADNGTWMIIVNGSSTGYKIQISDIVGSTFSAITDVGFYGGTSVVFVDGYFILNTPGTDQFYISDLEAATFTQIPNFASKEGAAGNIVNIAVMHRELWLFSATTTEVYYDTGAADFPWGRMPGVFIQQGLAAKNSLARFDLNLFWLGQDNNGKCTVFRGTSYQAVRISTHPIEDVLSSYADVSDAIGSFHQMQGHAFYVLTFPSADATWCYDLTTQTWHERSYQDANGIEHRVLPNFYVQAYGNTYCGDHTNGNLYQLDTNTFEDNGNPIVRLRSFPTLDDEVRIIYDRLTLDMSVGQGKTTGDYVEPYASVRWSDDGGKSWGDAVQVSLGKLGQTMTRPTLWRMGYGRRRVYEVSWSAPIDISINGAWIELRKGMS